MSVIARTSASTEEAREDETVLFPKEALTGVFFRWIDQTRELTDAPIEYLWSMFLVCVGMMIGRRACISNPMPLYPNFYLLFLGQSGSTRKSTVLSLGQHLLDLSRVQFKTLSGIVSSEGLIEALSEQPETKALAVADEFRKLLSVATRKGGQDLLPTLQSLYYGRTASVDRRKNPTTAIDPFFSLIGASPPEFIDDLLRERDITGGFLNRFLTIIGEPRETISRPKKLRDVAWHHILKPLHHLREIGSMELDFDADSGLLWDSWFRRWTADHRTLPVRGQQLTERTPEHALKIALLYSLVKNETAITPHSLDIALQVCRWLEAATLRTFRNIGVPAFDRCERDIIGTLRRSAERKMWRRDLQRAMSARGHNAEIFNRAIRSLEVNDQINLTPVETSARKKRTVVELL